MSTPLRLTKLRRNDPEAAVEVMIRGLAAGDWDPEYYDVISQMQDDPSRLDSLIDAALARNPDLASVLAKLH